MKNEIKIKDKINNILKISKNSLNKNNNFGDYW